MGVKDVTVHWHPDGTYLALQVSRFTKSGKTSYNGFEFFRVGERNIPMEVLELEKKQEKIVSFAWEPKGHRFAIVHGGGARPDVSFYTMQDGQKGQIKHLGTLHGRPVTSLHWSPQGKFLIIAGLKGLDGQLEFFNVNDMDTMAINEHFICTNVNRDRFFQFLWRPRMPLDLGKDKENEIQKNLKKYSKRFEAEDESLKSQADVEKMEERKNMETEWADFLESKKKVFEEIREEHEALVRLSGYVESEQSAQTEEIEVEEVVSVKEEKMPR